MIEGIRPALCPLSLVVLNHRKVVDEVIRRVVAPLDLTFGVRANGIDDIVMASSSQHMTPTGMNLYARCQPGGVRYNYV